MKKIILFLNIVFICSVAYAATKITDLTEGTSIDTANDVSVFVDVSDTTQASTGTTKKYKFTNLLTDANIPNTITIDTASDLSCTNCIGPTEITDLTLGTDTAGNYTLDIQGSLGIVITGAVAEGATFYPALDTTAALSGNHTLTANQAKFGQSGFIFEGSTSDAIELYLSIPDPASTDKTITFPNATDTLVGKDTTDTLTNKTLAAANNVIDADTAVALASNPSDCSANQFATTIAASGNLTCAQPAFSDLSGSATDAQIPDTITVSNYLALSGGTLTGALITDNLGIDFEDSDTNPGCAAGDYKIYADLSETKLKKCTNGSATDLDTTGGTPSFDTITGGTNTSAAMIIGTGASFSSIPKVGIGMSVPIALLDLSSTNNALRVNRVTNASTSITTPKNGMIAYDSSENELQAYINGTWVDVQTASDLVCTNCIGSTELSDITLGTDTAGNYANGDAEAGAALTGDTATAFFSAGTIEHERGGLEADVSGYSNGLFGTNGTSTIDVDTEAELETAVASLNFIISTEIDTSAEIATLVSNETGSGVVVFGTSPSLTTPSIAGATVTGTMTTTGTIQIANGYLRIPKGTSPLPASNCSDGQLFYDSDATTQQRLYACESGTWKLQGDGGGGSSSAYQILFPGSAFITGTIAVVGDATQGAQIDGSNGGVLLFDATTDEGAAWRFRLPDNWASHTDLKLMYAMTSATANEVDWEAAVMCQTAGDSERNDADGFAAIATASDTVPGTAMFPDTVTITLTDDSCAASDLITIFISTDADDATLDDATGDRRLLGVVYEYGI